MLVITADTCGNECVSSFGTIISIWFKEYPLIIEIGLLLQLPHISSGLGRDGDHCLAIWQRMKCGGGHLFSEVHRPQQSALGGIDVCASH